MTAVDVVDVLVRKGVVPSELRSVAEEELHRELSRRARRVSLLLAQYATTQQLATRAASMAA